MLEDKKIKILYVDPVVGTETAKKYPYYIGLLNGLILKENVDLKIFRGLPLDLDKLIFDSNFKPDFVFFGLGWFGHYKYFEEIKNDSNIPLIVTIFKPQNDLKNKISFCKRNKVKAILTPAPILEETKKETGIKTFLFEYGSYSEVFSKFHNEDKKYDIGFTGAMHESKLYPEGNFKNKNIRFKIKEKIEKLEAKCLWKGTDSFNDSRVHDYFDYAKTINSSKIWLATLASHGDVTPRYYEVMASKTLLFCEEPYDCYKDILKDNQNCVFFKSDMSDFDSKIDFYLNNEKERERIIKQANKDAFEINDWSVKADKLIKILESLND
jgi:hypothetical protein